MKPDSATLSFWPLSTAHKDFKKNAVAKSVDEPAVDDETKIVEGVAGHAAAALDDENVESADSATTSVGTQMVCIDRQTVSAVAAVAFAPARSTQDGEIQAAALLGGADSLAFWVALYLRDKVQGGSPNTLDAKTRDLARFVRWFVTINGLCDMRAWRPRDNPNLSAAARRARTLCGEHQSRLCDFAPFCTLGPR